MFRQLYNAINDKTSLNEKKLFLILFLTYCFSSLTFVGYPLWFKEPSYLCSSKESPEKWFECIPEQACNSLKYNYKLDAEKSPLSLSYDFKLVCENIPQKMVSQSIMLTGFLFGLIVNLFIGISSKIRKGVINFFMMIFGLSLIIPLFFSDNLQVISFSICVLNFAWGANFTHYIIFLAENFQEDFAKIGPVFYNLGFGVYTVLYPVISMLIRTNWKILFLLVGVKTVLCAVYFFTLTIEEKEPLIKQTLEDDEEANFSCNCGQILSIFKQKDIRGNFLILVFANICFQVYCVGMFLEVENLGGNFFLNLILMCIFDTCGSFFAGGIITKYNIFSSFKLALLVSGIGLGLFILIPCYPTTPSNILVFVLSITCLVSKMVLEMDYNFLVVLLGFVFPPEVIQVYYSGSFLLCRIPCSLLPFIIFYFRNTLHIYPFALFGFSFIFTWLLVKLFLNVDEKTCVLDQDARKEMKIGDEEIHASFVAINLQTSLKSGKFNEFSQKISKMSKMSKHSQAFGKFGNKDELKSPKKYELIEYS